MRASRIALHLTLALGGVAAATALLRGLAVSTPATVALTYLLVVLFVASSSTLAIAVSASVLAMLSLNFFFVASVGTFTLADTHNRVSGSGRELLLFAR